MKIIVSCGFGAVVSIYNRRMVCGMLHGREKYMHFKANKPQVITRLCIRSYYVFKLLDYVNLQTKALVYFP